MPRLKIYIFSCVSVLQLFVLISCKKNISHPSYIEGGGIFDVQGNFYETVIIGDQEWMSQNLKTRKYSNGENISSILGHEDFKVYNDDSSSIELNGLYYKYSSLEDTSSICPCGWHVPTEIEYSKLIDYLGGFKEAYTKLKSEGLSDDNTGLWPSHNQGFEHRGNNKSGFNALPSGFIFIENSIYKDTLARFWAISSNMNELLSYDIGSANYVWKKKLPRNQNIEFYFYSVRCVKNLE